MLCAFKLWASACQHDSICDILKKYTRPWKWLPEKKKKHAKNCQSYFDCTGPGTHLLVIYVVTSLSHSIHGTGTNAYTVGELFHGKCWVDICNTATNGSWSMVSVVFCQADIFDQFSLKVTSTGRVLCFLSTLGEEAVADCDCLTAISRQVQQTKKTGKHIGKLWDQKKDK